MKEPDRKKPTEEEVDELLDELADVLFDVWIADMKAEDDKMVV